MRKPPTQPSDADAPALKNGWLGLAVLGSVLIMAALILLNSRLLRDESAQEKSAAQNLCPQSGGPVAGLEASAPSICENRFSASPPRVTFYSALMAPEDQRRIPIGSAGATTAEADASSLPHDTVDKGDPKSAKRAPLEPKPSRRVQDIPILSPPRALAQVGRPIQSKLALSAILELPNSGP
jgi:hypothetical protein